MSTGTLVAGPLPKIGRQELQQIAVPEATLTHHNTLCVSTFLLQLLDYSGQISHRVSLGQGS